MSTAQIIETNDSFFMNIFKEYTHTNPVDKKPKPLSKVEEELDINIFQLKRPEPNRKSQFEMQPMMKPIMKKGIEQSNLRVKR